ncbi:hypothetical protein TSUD_84910 [Trifolium subterraneum]|uniref:Uncharacterized protein n=1 Tax=Trifolium subterraneum TaxID=3900 RepID=A0A2Z6MD36_TRISU|nr:hypothetical protein TSUD_84910 [Trifolium subterraneum]
MGHWNRKLIKEFESALEKCEEQKKEMSEKLKALCDEETVRKEKLARSKKESAKIARLVGFAKFKMV